MKKSSKILVAVLCLLMLLTSIPVFAASAPYETYTYSMKGDPMASPHAYVPERTVSNFDMGLSSPLTNPQDLFVDPQGMIYISDAPSGTNGVGRVIVLDSDFKYQFEITEFINQNGIRDSFSKPDGLFVNEENIYVCDADNQRIVVFDLVGNFVRMIEAPQADVMGDRKSVV